MASTVSKRIVKDSRLMATQTKFLTNFKTKEMLSCVLYSNIFKYIFLSMHFYIQIY